MEAQKNEGKKLSFHQLFSEMEFNVVIPIIQRDYAQGRKKAESIRNQFVSSLFDALLKGNGLHLDFVYGNVENGDFIPLDGQQRLTTLFLLHWYLSIKDEKFNEFQALLIEQEISKFTYKTRISSRSFCDALVKNKIEINEQFPTFTDYIKNCDWYFASWDRDPTIKSMLVMLDTIDQIYNELEVEQVLYNSMVNESNPIITFQFIELKDFGLSDSLYIKMNARGKPLTDFENFKAKFEQLLKEFDTRNKTNFKAEFENKIDSEWADLFWKFRSNGSELFDNEFMNFVRVVLTNSLASRKGVDMEALKVMTRDKASFGYYELAKFGAFSDKGLNDLMSFLQLINKRGNFKGYLKHNQSINEKELFVDVTSYDLTYIKRLQFYALYKFLERYSNGGGIEEWMRVIRNLTANSVYRQADTFETAIKSIDVMLENAQEILLFFQNDNKPKGFLQYQMEEEQIKSNLIIKDKKWRSEIEQIENHKYFNGQIEFILNFSGISSYFYENKNLDWSDKINTKLLDKFISYSNLASRIFDSEGLVPMPANKFRRALLTFGDFTLKKSRNNSFLVNVDREIGWKRLLRDSDNKKRVFVKELFDEILLNKGNIVETLDAIIVSSTVSDWRKYFIERSDCMDKCGKEHLFRVGYNDDYYDLLLLEKRQTNGMHREYYTYALACSLREEGHNVAYRPSNSIDYWKCIEKVNGKVAIIKWLSPREIVDSNVGYSIELSEDPDVEGEFMTTELEVLNYLKKQQII